MSYDDEIDDYYVEEWSEPDIWDDDPTDMLLCPECGEEVYEFADLCPHCGMFITPSAAAYNPWQGRPLWWLALAVIGIMGFLLSLQLLF